MVELSTGRWSPRPWVSPPEPSVVSHLSWTRHPEYVCVCVCLYIPMTSCQWINGGLINNTLSFDVVWLTLREQNFSRLLLLFLTSLVLCRNSSRDCFMSPAKPASTAQVKAINRLGGPLKTKRVSDMTHQLQGRHRNRLTTLSHSWA